MVEARLLDLGNVSPLRSQTIFHSVAECAAADDPPTLCVLSPDGPYVSIGYHQDAEREIDLGFCAANRIPVLRRKVGGGAVLLDSEQLFFHLIVPAASVERLGLPLRLDRRYRRLCAPALAAYARLGVAADFREPNDLFVGTRKVGGTGAATIGDSFVFVGSLMRDFDHALMARVLRIADEALRERIEHSIRDGVTSLRELLRPTPPMDHLRAALLSSFRDELGLGLAPGRLSVREIASLADHDRSFASDEWLHAVRSSRPTRRLTINASVRYLEAEAGGARVTARVRDGVIDDVWIDRMLPGEAAEGVRRALIGAHIAGGDELAGLARAAAG